jgi:hypothetical protein
MAKRVEKKLWQRWLWAAMVVIVLAIVIVVAVTAQWFKEKPTTPAGSVPFGTLPISHEDEPQPKTWQKVAELSGTASKRSAPFYLSGAQARMKYSVQGQESTAFYAYVVEEGESRGPTEVVVTKPSSDETRLAKTPGNYYLDISTVNTTWTVTIEELR